MKQVFILSLLWLVFFFRPLMAQDSLRIFSLQEVTIRESPLAHYASGSRTLQVDSLLLALYPQASLSELLSLQAPVYFRSYGQGQLSSLSLRGTDAGHTAVLWNGFALNSPTSGSADFSQLPATGFNQVELQYGNSAASWGSGAIGGSVLLSSTPEFNKGWQGTLQSEVSRMGEGDLKISPFYIGYLSSQARLAYSNAQLHLSGGLWQQRAENDFPYRNTRSFGSPEVRQENAAFHQWGFTQEADWKLGTHLLLSSRIWYTYTDRQAQPAIGEANLGNRRLDEALRTMLAAEWQHAKGKTMLRSAFFKEALSWNGANSPVYTWQGQLSHERRFFQSLLLKVGAEGQHYQADIAANYSRTQKRAAFSFQAHYTPRSWMELSLNLRQVLVEGFSPAFVPHLGTSWQLFKNRGHQLGLRANAGKAYRVPALHDLYWIPSGNPDLLPEESLGYETGLQYSQTRGRLGWGIEASYYHNLISNWIRWTPVGGTEWQPRNLLQVESQGLELVLNASLRMGQSLLKARGEYAYTASVYRKGSTEQVGKQLELTPLHTAMASLQFVQGSRWITLTYSFTGLRYNFGGDKLPYYQLVHLNVGQSLLGKRVQVVIKGHNLLNAFYQTYPYYALPGRHYSLSLRLALHP
jgi:vitamin B12 transporter